MAGEAALGGDVDHHDDFAFMLGERVRLAVDIDQGGVKGAGEIRRVDGTGTAEENKQGRKNKERAHEEFFRS